MHIWTRRHTARTVVVRGRLFRLAVSAPACEKQRALKGARPAAIVEPHHRSSPFTPPALALLFLLKRVCVSEPCTLTSVHCLQLQPATAPASCILVRVLCLPYKGPSPPPRHTAQRRRHIYIRLPPGRAGISFQASTFLLRRNKGYAHSVVYLASGYATKPLHAGNPSMNRFHLALRPA